MTAELDSEAVRLGNLHATLGAPSTFGRQTLARLVGLLDQDDGAQVVARSYAAMSNLARLALFVLAVEHLRAFAFPAPDDDEGDDLP